MSARERLLDALNGNFTPMEPPESLIDDYAHELAEKIRRELPERVKKLTGFWAEIRTVSTAQHAADLIDPYKEGL